MEKSIETIWKEGFLNPEALVAPKLNDLYNQKSLHIIDKYKKMFKMNMVMITIGSSLFLIASFFIGIPYMGVPLFLILNAMVLVDKNLLKKLEGIDKDETSYDYLKKLKNWMKLKTIVNIKVARIFYPYAFISVILGIWFVNVRGKTLGETVVNELLMEFPDMAVVFGLPLVFVIGGFVIIGLLAYFGGRIYQWDVKLVYGGVLKKLDELLADMEELRA